MNLGRTVREQICGRVLGASSNQVHRCVPPGLCFLIEARVSSGTNQALMTPVWAPVWNAARWSFHSPDLPLDR